MLSRGRALPGCARKFRVPLANTARFKSELKTTYATYMTYQGGDAVRIPAAVFPEEQSCGSAAKKRRRSPSPRARRRPAATRALPAQKGAGRRAAASRAESGVHQGTLSKARRAEQNHLPRSRAALPAHLASLTRGMSSSHPPPPATPPGYSKVRVRLRQPHPSAPKCTKQAGGPHSTERGAGQGMTRQILSAAAPLSYVRSENIQRANTRTGFLSDS